MHNTQQAALAARFLAVFTANDMLFDASNVTVSGGKVTEWVDRINPTRKFVQADSAKQIVTPTTSAAFGGATVGVFTAGPYYTATGTTADWAFLTDGSGYEVIAVASATAGNLLANSNASANPSMEVELNTAKVRLIHRSVWPTTILNGVSTSTVSTPRIFGVSLAPASTPQFFVRIGNTIEASGSPSSAPTGTAAIVPYLGCFTPAFNLMAGSLRSLYFFRRRLQSSERATVHAYIKATTGI